MLAELMWRFRQAAWRPRRQVHHPELVQCSEREPLAVGRWPGAANLRHGDRGVVQRIVELRQRAELLLDVGAERNVRGAASGDVDAAELAVPRRDQRLRVR